MLRAISGGYWLKLLAEERMMLRLPAAVSGRMSVFWKPWIQC